MFFCSKPDINSYGFNNSSSGSKKIELIPRLATAKEAELNGIPIQTVLIQFRI